MVKILTSNIWKYLKSKFENNPSNIKMNGTPSAGTNNTIARSDHTHPHDNTKADKNHEHPIASESENGFIAKTDKLKLDNIESNANNYTHPAFTRKALGLYKVNVDGNGHVSQTSPITLDDLAEIGVPTSKQDYVHPTPGAKTGKPTTDQVPGFGDQITISQVQSNNQGHVDKLYDRKITIPGTVASNSVKGLMSTQDKIKLDNIEANANKITVDTTLTETSNNPISNNAVTNALNNKANNDHQHTINNINNLQSTLDGKSDTNHIHDTSRDRYVIHMGVYDTSTDTFVEATEDNLKISIVNSNSKLACIVRNKWTGAPARELANTQIFLMINGESYPRTLNSNAVSGTLDINMTTSVLVLAKLKSGSGYNSAIDVKFAQRNY